MPTFKAMSDERASAPYDFQAAERAWQARWEADALYAVPEGDVSEPAYILEMLPYPSGDLHVGHAKNYTLGDCIARMHRMRGRTVLHPMGWDAFGLPAENAAIKRGIDPERWTRSNIANMQRQVRAMGTSYDWTREFATCDPSYYRWNQWLFLRMFEAGLAYKREAPVNWCPVDGTVLANEQVENGACWRCGAAVERKNLSQWFFRITAYADRLLAGLDELPEWPERIKTMQRNWIGKSEGAIAEFVVPDAADARIAVYTTRVDTLFGVTYLALAAEHPLVDTLMRARPERAPEIAAFAESLKSRSDLERTSLMEKSGVFTGAHAVHPLSGERVPIWVTNYVLAEYGTGAVMGVPAHDERDYAFAERFELPKKIVVVPSAGAAQDDAAYVEDGVLVASDEFSGLDSSLARKAITDKLVATGLGRGTVNYRIRDWLISRQRYWGTPIPIVVCPTDGLVPVPDDALPVELPLGIPITGEGSPLARDAAFRETTCPKCGGPAERETDTMDTFVDSSWYYLRYLDPHNAERPFAPEKARRFMPVGQYIGGAEHAVMHLLYARFFYKVLADNGMVAGQEPFARLFNQGMVLADGEKMSKSRGNVVGIDETIATYGVDAMRLYLMKAAPPEDTMNWTTEGIVGRTRFLQRLWRACAPHLATAARTPTDRPPQTHAPEDAALVRAVHEALRSAAEEARTRRFHYNVTLAKFDEVLNALGAASRDGRVSDAVTYAVHVLPRMLAPFAPHIAEELWARLGYAESVHSQPWLDADEGALVSRTITIVVQINGKIRARLEVAPGETREAVERAALAEPNVRAHLAERTPRKIVFVPDKLLNIVI